jgi:hypothetical protein
LLHLPTAAYNMVIIANQLSLLRIIRTQGA